MFTVHRWQLNLNNLILTYEASPNLIYFLSEYVKWWCKFCELRKSDVLILLTDTYVSTLDGPWESGFEDDFSFWDIPFKDGTFNEWTERQLVSLAKVKCTKERNLIMECCTIDHDKEHGSQEAVFIITAFSAAVSIIVLKVLK